MFRFILTAIFLSALFARQLQAQDVPLTPSPSPATYQISGAVRSGKNSPPGRHHNRHQYADGEEFAAASSTEGKFEFSGIPRGRYVIRIEFMGFALFTRESYSIRKIRPRSLMPNCFLLPVNSRQKTRTLLRPPPAAVYKASQRIQPYLLRPEMQTELRPGMQTMANKTAVILRAFHSMEPASMLQRNP